MFQVIPHLFDNFIAINANTLLKKNQGRAAEPDLEGLIRLSDAWNTSPPTSIYLPAERDK